MRKGLTYMLLGLGIGIGALATYQQYRNGNMQRAYNKITDKARKSQENMM